MTAQDLYTIFFNECGKLYDWPPTLDAASTEAQRAFDCMLTASRVGGDAPSGSEGSPEDLAPGEYPGAQFQPGWVFDTVEIGGEVKTILKAMVSLPLGGGGSASCRFEWFTDSTVNRDGTDLSGGFRSILTAGVTEEDLREWQRGGPLVGLDRNKGTAVVETDKGGYLKVKYFNAPGGRVVAKAPPTRAQQALVGQQMLAALARLGKK